MCTVCFFRKLKRQIKLNTKRKKTSEVRSIFNTNNNKKPKSIEKKGRCRQSFFTYDYLALFINLHALSRKSYK